MASVTARAAAKINLFLAAGALRADGFHELATVFHAVSLYDEVTAADADGLHISVVADDDIDSDEVPTDHSNLVARAAMLLAKRARLRPDVHLHIRKSIPVAGGMAGGSADAAAALVACDALWRTKLTRAQLADLAVQVGSDVSFALLGGTAIGTGRGEILTPALAHGRFEWVLALSARGLSTPEVYRECDRLRRQRVLPEPRVSDDVMTALRAGNAVALGHALHNDLQAAACSLRPELTDILRAGLGEGALGGIVSGSGPTVAFLVSSDDDADRLVDALVGTGACSGVRRAHGPASGVRLVDGR